MDALAGDRVVVRYRLDAGGPDDRRPAPNPPLEHSPSLSDITGILVAADDAALVIRRDGVDHPVPRTAVTSLRLLSAEVVRNSQIRTVQAELATGLTGERAEIDGWELVADPDSSSPRAVSAAPVGPGAHPVSLPALADWFSARGLRGAVVLPERLTRPGDGPPGGAEYEVLTAAGLPPAEALGTDLPARQSLRAQGYRRHHSYRLVPL